MRLFNFLLRYVDTLSEEGTEILSVEVFDHGGFGEGGGGLSVWVEFCNQLKAVQASECITNYE